MGDRLVVRGSRRGDPGRSAQILEVRGAGGEPPYVVRWADGHTSAFFPGENAVVHPAPRPPADTARFRGRAVVLSWAARGAWRGVVFVLGLLLCAVGIALLFLPGPGLLVLAAGVALLATEFRWARTLLTRAQARLHAYRPRPPGSS